MTAKFNKFPIQIKRISTFPVLGIYLLFNILKVNVTLHAGICMDIGQPSLTTNRTVVMILITEQTHSLTNKEIVI